MNLAFSAEQVEWKRAVRRFLATHGGTAQARGAVGREAGHDAAGWREACDRPPVLTDLKRLARLDPVEHLRGLSVQFAHGYRVHKLIVLHSTNSRCVLTSVSP